MVRVDKEFAGLIPPLATEELAQLEASIIEEGCRDPLTLWAGRDILLDGHNRLSICRKRKIKYKTRSIKLPDRDAARRWVLINQLARRNLTPEAAAALRGRLYLDVKRQGARTDLTSPQNGEKLTTAEQLAAKFKVGKNTIERDAKFSEQLDDLADHLGGDFRDSVLSRDTPVSRKDVAALHKMPKGKRKKAAKALLTGKSRSVRDFDKHETASKLKAKRLPRPKGKFDVIVVDPPWPYEKRAEDATHRARLPYPPMPIEDIRRLAVAKHAEPDCILWLWTTNAFLHEGFHCLEEWGFSYKVALTWAKDKMGVGDWLRGKTEHCLLAVRGRPTVVLTNQTTLLEAPRLEHSRKPKKFYIMVERLCPGTKLEMFACEKRKGWQSWGAEKEKFSGE